VLRVRDEATGAVKTYINPQGRPFQPIVDSDAFDCSDIPHSRGRGAIRRGAKELERDSRGPAAPLRGTTTQPGG